MEEPEAFHDLHRRTRPYNQNAGNDHTRAERADRHDAYDDSVLPRGSDGMHIIVRKTGIALERGKRNGDDIVSAIWMAIHGDCLEASSSNPNGQTLEARRGHTERGGQSPRRRYRKNGSRPSRLLVNACGV